MDARVQQFDSFICIWYKRLLEERYYCYHLNIPNFDNTKIEGFFSGILSVSSCLHEQRRLMQSALLVFRLFFFSLFQSCSLLYTVLTDLNTFSYIFKKPLSQNIVQMRLVEIKTDLGFHFVCIMFLLLFLILPNCRIKAWFRLDIAWNSRCFCLVPLTSVTALCSLSMLGNADSCHQIRK